MKIGFDAKRAFHNYTGLGNYSRFVINALRQYYPENEYYLYSPSLQTNADTESIIKGAEIITAPQWYRSLGLKSIWRSLFLFNSIKKSHVEVFHGLSNELPAFGGDEIKKVVTIHDLIFLRYPELFQPLDRKIYTYKFEYACRKADVIIAVSRQTKNDIVHFFKTEARKIKVVYQGCHPNFKKSFNNEDLEVVKKRYQLPDTFILNVGTIEKRKNVRLILEAMVVGQWDLPLVVVGKATAYMNELMAYVSEHDLREKVIFLHDVSFSDLPALYDLAALFVYPSIFEGFGIPIIEALERNIPVVTSKGSCFSEAGGDLALYADPENARELAEKINMALALDTQSTSYKQKLAQHLQQFTPSKIAEDLNKVYKGLGSNPN